MSDESYCPPMKPNETWTKQFVDETVELTYATGNKYRVTISEVDDDE